MQMQDWFYFWGTFFFVSWFIFMIVGSIVMYQLYQRTVKLQEEIERKLNEPQSVNIMGLLSLVPPLFSAGKRLFRR